MDAHIVSFGLRAAILFLCQRKFVRALFISGVVAVFPRERFGDPGSSRRLVSGRNAFRHSDIVSYLRLEFEPGAPELDYASSVCPGRDYSRRRNCYGGSGLPVTRKLMTAFGGGLAGDATLWTCIGVVGGASSGLLGSFALRCVIANDSAAKVKVAAG